VGRDSSVGIATRYGLEGPGIERPMEVDERAPGDYATDRHPLAPRRLAIWTAIPNMATRTAQGRIMDTGILGGVPNTTEEDADDN
jgi:hypothetical protein